MRIKKNARPYGYSLMSTDADENDTFNFMADKMLNSCKYLVMFIYTNGTDKLREALDT
jgi:hypothetical protein